MASRACPSCGSTVHTGVEVQGVYDGALYWVCGFGHRYHRWPDGDWRREKAEEHWMRVDENTRVTSND
mgnify:FL=1